MYKKITEGKAAVYVPAGSKVTRAMPVFYNPAMRLNRDISVLLLSAIGRKMNIGLPLAGSGIRGIRLFLESGVKCNIAMNDQNEAAYSIMKKNLQLNNITGISIHNKDASMFLLDSEGFDYIDIDPFGSPNPFLDPAVRRLSRYGILAVTATDTAPLCGSYPDACLRKYWAVPRRDYQMHETGLRILIRKIQLIGAQYDRALIPLFSYSRQHYFRVFLQSTKGKSAVDRILKHHGISENAGPLWLGRLWDQKLAEKMYLKNRVPENNSFLRVISDESRVDSAWFYELNSLAKKCRTKNQKKSSLIGMLRKKGYTASETHFSPAAIRSNIEKKELVRLLIANKKAGKR